jgi:hypothetical protein
MPNTPIKRRYVIRATCLAMSVALTAVTFAVHAQAGAPVIYPAKGQAPMQQDRDRYECHDWARSQSGFDPTQPSQPVAMASQPASSGASLSNMARGAAGGAAIAELTHHDAGRGAATGLVGASVIGRVREQQAMQAKQQQLASQQQAARSRGQSTYERGFAACMEARGYVVK